MLGRIIYKTSSLSIKNNNTFSSLSLLSSSINQFNNHNESKKNNLQQKSNFSTLTKKISSSSILLSNNMMSVNLNSKRNLNIIHDVQQTIIAYKEFTNFPWWLAIASATFTIRSFLSPLDYYSTILSKNLSKAIPELNYLTLLYSTRLKEIKLNTKENFSLYLALNLTYYRGVSACLNYNDVKYFQILLTPLLSMSIFWTYIISLRELFTIENNYTESLESGGLSIFTNLTESDPTLILPILSLSLNYYYFELLANKNNTIVYNKFNNIIQSLLILSLPFVADLPLGVFFYWIPSSLCSYIKLSATLGLPRFIKVFIKDKEHIIDTTIKKK